MNKTPHHDILVRVCVTEVMKGDSSSISFNKLTGSLPCVCVCVYVCVCGDSNAGTDVSYTCVLVAFRCSTHDPMYTPLAIAAGFYTAPSTPPAVRCLLKWSCKPQPGGGR